MDLCIDQYSGTGTSRNPFSFLIPEGSAGDFIGALKSFADISTARHGELLKRICELEAAIKTHDFTKTGTGLDDPMWQWDENIDMKVELEEKYGLKTPITTRKALLDLNDLLLANEDLGQLLVSKYEAIGDS